MAISDSSDRKALGICRRDGIGGTTQIISVIFGSCLALESFLQGVILLLGLLELSRERDEHAEKVFGLGDHGVFTVKYQEKFQVLFKTLTDLDNLLDAFFIGISEFLIVIIIIIVIKRVAKKSKRKRKRDKDRESAMRYG